LEQYGADLILGCKLGFVWVGEHVKAMDSTTIEDQLNNTEQQLIKYKTTSKDMLQESRQSSALNLGIDEMLRSNLYEIWNSMTK
jgi:hypothetical protein